MSGRPWFVFKGHLSMQHIQIRRLWEVLGNRRLLHVRPKHRSSMLWRSCCPIRCFLFPWPTFRVDLWKNYQDILDIYQRQRQLVQSCIGRRLECLIHCRRSMIQWRCMWPFCQRNQHLITVLTMFIKNRQKTKKILTWHVHPLIQRGSLCHKLILWKKRNLCGLLFPLL